MGARNIIIAIIFAIIAIVIYFQLWSTGQPASLPDLGEQWWGPGKSGNEDTSIKPFTINFPEKVSKLK